jgi:ribosomal protein S18 acetylase RimI-like enzyme
MTTFSAAQEDDVPALSALLAQLFAQEHEFKPDGGAQRRGLSMIIRNPDQGIILVAREGDAVVAMVNLLYTISTALGERVATLEDMMVSHRCRGTGVGSALLRHAIQHCEDSGIKRITLLTDPDNDTAQRFYEGHGFRRSAMVPMRLHLPQR